MGSKIGLTSSSDGNSEPVDAKAEVAGKVFEQMPQRVSQVEFVSANACWCLFPLWPVVMSGISSKKLKYNLSIAADELTCSSAMTSLNASSGWVIGKHPKIGMDSIEMIHSLCISR